MRDPVRRLGGARGDALGCRAGAGARLHVGLLDCSEINRQSATIEFSVPANGERKFTCIARFNSDTPTNTFAYLRQPLNGVLTPDFAYEEVSIGILGRDGFEGEGGK